MGFLHHLLPRGLPGNQANVQREHRTVSQSVRHGVTECTTRCHRVYDTVSQSVRHGVTECTTRCQTVHRMASTVFREDAARSAEDSDHYINDGAKEMVHAVRWDSCSRSTSISHIS